MNEEEILKIIDDKSIELNNNLQQNIEKRFTDAAVSKQNLLQFSLEKIAEHSTLDELFEFMKYFARQLKFFPDDEIITYFRKLGLNTLVLRWFIPLKEIIEEFNVIEHKGIRIAKVMALEFIEQHLDIKIAVDILKIFTGIVHDDGVNMNIATKKFKQVIERRKKYHKLFIPTKFDEIVDSIEKVDPKTGTKILLKSLEGKTEYSELRFLFDHCFFRDSNFSKRKFRIAIYELCRIIMKDFKRKLPDKNTYFELKDPSEPTWNGFRAKQINTIIYKV